MSMILKMTAAFVIALVVSTLFGRIYIPWLHRQRAEQPIKGNGPEWHKKTKKGTPTMGGVMFIFAVAVSILTVGFSTMMQGEFAHLFVFVFALVFGAIGLLDDWEKIKNRQNTGLSARMKFLLQLAAALAFIVLMRNIGLINTELYLPWNGGTLRLPEWLYFVFAAFVIVGTVNAVNITDGIDGLVSGTSLPVCLFFACLTFSWGERYLAQGIFASALMGGLMGFLVYNFNPAKVFMGDTGSLFLGGAIAALAFVYDMPLILLSIGIIYIIETMSDIIQVGYFKLSHGKRVFKMAPFHHHLEMGGWTGKRWKEKELFFLFTGISLLAAIISFLWVYRRF